MTPRERIDEVGYDSRAGLFDAADCERLLGEWERLTADNPHPALLRAEDGSIYGARNLLELWPEVVDRVLTSPLRDTIRSVLGGECGLVRVLFFDKPPDRSWALPWHRDLRVAVLDNSLPSSEFGKPTLKYGIPHLEAPRWLLERMLTLRLHLDRVTDENGPLRVVPGSHRDSRMGEPEPSRVRTIHAEAGDVLLMRPLLSHSSNHSLPGCVRHRRILHFEFSGVRDLPDGIAWHDFVPI